MTVEGYTSIRSARVRLGGLNVLIGPNGAGKSNFVSALELLGRILDEDLQLFVGLRGGAGALLHGGPRGGTPGITVRIEAPPHAYLARLVPSARDELVFETEEISGLAETAVLGHGHRETLLHRRTGSRAERATAGQVTEILDGCRVHHFHDTSRTAPVKRFANPADNLTLAPDAGNLAAYLLRLATEDTAAYRRIVRAVGQVAPFFRDFVLVGEHAGVRLRWRQAGMDGVLGPESLSDGTLRFICLATLLLCPDPQPLIILDEPELGLHPFALVQLAGMLRSASQTSQIVVATQSVPLVDHVDHVDLIIVDRTDGISTFHRPNPADLAAWLDDYSLGELWQKNILGGLPTREDG
ncbi:AAA family ATPase [Frankia sp. CIT1]|uniref:AAA family ATPase n=1 Tax=Frankia sp. CIT1 TaxID=2880974 RepID=UPI001EF3FCD6|nr:AAA family ATPase [Frankia sp. CIT1]